MITFDSKMFYERSSLSATILGIMVTTVIDLIYGMDHITEGKQLFFR
jgi:hypothetical protein